MSLGARIKELRTKKRVSLQAVADAVGISKTHIWDIERGASKNPSIEILGKLSEYFRVSVSELIGEKSESKYFALNRELDKLEESDVEIIKDMIQSLKDRKGQ